VNGTERLVTVSNPLVQRLRVTTKRATFENEVRIGGQAVIAFLRNVLSSGGMSE
jgi:hypothetical protein